ncbi:MAG: alpha/beta hydrolase [Bacteroidia bacterium]|nr:alpha/beta hydrolase [Bacteroidia bacterium]
MLHYSTYEIGPNYEWVTFIHGAGGSSSIWFRQIKEFSKLYNILLIDLRGHGKSKEHNYRLLNSYSFDQIGDDIIEVLDHLNIAATHFVGISMGSIIIREITDRHPRRVRSLIMGGAIMDMDWKSKILMWFGMMFKSIIPYMLLYRMYALIILPRRTHRDSRQLFIREAKKLDQKEFLRWFSLTTQLNSLLHQFRENVIASPTLYIMGDEDHMFLPAVSKLVENHENAQLCVLRQCGHVVNIQRPKEFNANALSFLVSLKSKLIKSH